MNYNRVLIAGNLTADPELRYTTRGAAVVKFSLAINRKWKDESGELKEEVTFVNDVTAFGRTAENVGEYLRKGSSCFVEGRLHLDQWDDKQTGKPRSRLKVVCDTVQFVGGKRDGAAAPQRPAAGKPPAAAGAKRESGYEADDGPPPTPEEDSPPF